MKIKVSELFYSIQGEGRYMGVPSVFLRTFGCNFTCDGFGMPEGKKSQERHQIAEKIELFKNYKELPLVRTGCDSYASWDPRFKDLSPVISTDTLADAITDLLPNKIWKDEHLVITGGEPLLGWQKSYPDLLAHPKMSGLKEITFETNGTQKLTPSFKEFLTNWGKQRSYPHGQNSYRNGNGWNSITFSVSAKLPVSGESWKDAIKPKIVCEYEEVGHTYLKFVVASEKDVKDALRAVDEYRQAGFLGQVYVMPVGGVESIYEWNNHRVATLAMKHGLRYSDRLQVPLFKNEWGT